MRLGRAALLVPVLAILLVSTSVTADDEENLEDMNFEDEEDSAPKEKISTSLRLENDSKRNTTEKIRDAMESAMKVPSRTERFVENSPKSHNASPSQKSVTFSISSRMSNESSSPSYERVRSLFSRMGRNNSTRELTLPIDTNVAQIHSEEETDDELPEELPEAQELRLVRPGRGRRPFYRPHPPSLRRPPQLNRRNVFPAEGLRSPPKRPGRRPTERPEKKNVRKKEADSEGCKYFTKTVCLEATNYPHEAIMRSIRANKEMAAALLTDYKSQESSESDNRAIALPLENRYESRYENRYENNEIKRRSDYPYQTENVEEGFTCPSIVMYARPQLARAVSGVWKYIINTGEHTQTLRLEKCSNPKASCSFISENYRSSCTQVYNYHRLLTWESSLGLHMDIFKVPTCCSCHVHGYADLYPPIQKDPPPTPKEVFPGADFATEDLGPDEPEFSNRPTSYLTKFKPEHSSNFDTNFVPSSKKPSISDAGTSNRPSYTLPGRRKKPSASSRPYEKLPQQHAPNTRAPGYKGPILKTKRPSRPSRPYRRESNTDLEESPSNSMVSGSSSTSTSSSSSNMNNNWFSQQFDQDTDSSSRLHNGGFDEEYQDTHRRVNYDYHPIIDFFKPEASMLQSPEPLIATQASSAKESNSDSWTPMIAS